jgi:hypothetical protein
MKTRARDYTPDQSIHPHADSVKRAQFYYAWDSNDGPGRVTARSLFQSLNLPSSTAYDWLHTRALIGDIAARRGDEREAKRQKTCSLGSGRPRIIPNPALQALIHSDQQSRRQRLSLQARSQGIQASHRTLQRSLRRLNVAMFKSSTQSPIMVRQGVERKDFSTQYRFHHLHGF